jgi:hypothetical protein
VTTGDVWATLTVEERATVLRLCMPSMRKVPRLLTLRHQSRQAGLANREIAGANAGRLAFMKWLYGAGRLSDRSHL